MTMLQCVYIVPYEVLYARFFVLFHSCFASNNDACLGCRNHAVDLHKLLVILVNVKL